MPGWQTALITAGAALLTAALAVLADRARTTRHDRAQHLKHERGIRASVGNPGDAPQQRRLTHPGMCASSGSRMA